LRGAPSRPEIDGYAYSATIRDWLLSKAAALE
jgi:hypothetical protein